MTNLPMRDAFDLPEGVIYLDGNSLGPLSHLARERIAQTIDAEWGRMLIRAWTQSGWVDLPGRVGDRIARLIGAVPGSVVVCDSTSVNVHKVLAAALQLRPGRSVILSDEGNFPTDLYVAQGLVRTLDKGHALKIVPPEEVVAAIDDKVAVVMLTQVDYRTGRLHDMAAITKAAHRAGALVIWDLAHSAGALPVDLQGCGADFAVGCGYKYLNGGPGAPAFVYVRPDLVDQVLPAPSGWFGHAAPFDFDLEFRPDDSIGRMRVGTPPVLSMVALDAALELWMEVDMNQVRTRSIALADRFIAGVDVACAGQGLRLATPRDGTARGSQVSFHCPHGYAVMQALIARGVIGDFRAPDLIRFGFAPLYNTEEEIDRAVAALADILTTRAWDTPAFHAKAAVT